jgi:hypothetical protein
MGAKSGFLRVFGSILLCGNLLTSGCSALIAESGQNVAALTNKSQVHQSFGTPDNSGSAAGGDFEEFRTRRKISEPTVASVNFMLGMETLGLVELWNFPAITLQNAWNTLVGQTLRFEYGSHGEVQDVLINGTSMKSSAQLP